jgi:hypothetical protein
MNRKPTEGEKKQTKNIILSLAENLGLTLTNAEDIQSRHSYNKYVFKYESLFSDVPLELIIETSFYQDVYPAETHDVYSFVGKFCEKKKIVLPIPFDEVKISMQEQSLE